MKNKIAMLISVSLIGFCLTAMAITRWSIGVGDETCTVTGDGTTSTLTVDTIAATTIGATTLTMTGAYSGSVTNSASGYTNTFTYVSGICTAVTTVGTP